MSTIHLAVRNEGSNDLSVWGSQGSDLSNLATGGGIYTKAEVEANPDWGWTYQINVADFNTPGFTADNYDWVYLQDETTSTFFQIYCEFNNYLADYKVFKFGYYNPKSTESNYNPSPFPDDCWKVEDNGDVVYVLLKTPPPFTNLGTPPK
jgi:hypothetical protein